MGSSVGLSMTAAVRVGLMCRPIEVCNICPDSDSFIHHFTVMGISSVPLSIMSYMAVGHYFNYRRKGTEARRGAEKRRWGLMDNIADVFGIKVERQLLSGFNESASCSV